MPLPVWRPSSRRREALSAVRCSAGGLWGPFTHLARSRSSGRSRRDVVLGVVERQGTSSRSVEQTRLSLVGRRRARRATDICSNGRDLPPGARSEHGIGRPAEVARGCGTHCQPTASHDTHKVWLDWFPENSFALSFFAAESILRCDRCRAALGALARKYLLLENAYVRDINIARRAESAHPIRALM